jgi:hypothetical protein
MAAGYPSFDPQGNRLVFAAAGEGGGSDIYVVGLAPQEELTASGFARPRLHGEGVPLPRFPFVNAGLRKIVSGGCQPNWSPQL